MLTPIDRWHCERAWLGPGRVAAGVLLRVEGGRIAQVEVGVPPPPGAVRLSGLTLPGFANAHCHAVGEFHYLHHQPGGRPYQDPNAMGKALCAAAADAGIRLTLLDTCYLWSGFGRRVPMQASEAMPLMGTRGSREPNPVQRRFSDGTPAAWAARVERLLGLGLGETLPEPGLVRVGAAIHSVRALAPEELAEVAAWARAAGVPLHFHLSEQVAENDDCLAHTGLRPTALLDEAGALGPRTTAVHATHLDADDLRRLGAAGAFACFCPTTERDLGDGIGPAAELRDAGVRLCVGSDSNAVVDPFEETRAVELDDRLRLRRRGIHDPDQLLTAATAHGYAALGWDPVGLQPGSLADFVTVSLNSERLAPAGATGGDGDAGDDAGAAADPDQDLAAAVLFAAAPGDVTDVVVGGRQVVAAGRHARYDDVAGLLTAAARGLSRL